MKKRHIFQFSRKAEDDFAALEKPLQRRIFKKLKFFEQSDNPLEFAVKLKGTEDRFRYRVGDYRIIITLKDKNTFIILLILKIAHRREVSDGAVLTCTAT